MSNRAALVAEEQAARFAAAGRHGVVLRLGLLDGPGTGHDQSNPARVSHRRFTEATGWRPRH
jgi:hypothetical protein